MLVGVAVSIAFLIISTLAKPLDVLERRVLPPPAGCAICNGTENGLYYTSWSDGIGSVNYTNNAINQFTLKWQTSGNFIGGKGWLPGATSRVINYSGVFNSSGSSTFYLGVYGWTTNPLIEYHVVEFWGSIAPPGSSMALTYLGTTTSDGETYDIYHTTRVNQPSINGTQTFKQLWSVRRTKRTSGRVVFADHANVWANRGMPLGSHNYQIVAIKGQSSSGSAVVTIG